MSDIALETSKVYFKVSKNNKGYLLFERRANDKTYRMCLFENHWRCLEPLIGCISYDVFEGKTAKYKWYAYKPNTYVQDQGQYINVLQYKEQWYVILGLVDKRSDRAYSWWLTKDDWGRLINETFKIRGHIYGEN